jgi:hypothetical protein
LLIGTSSALAQSATRWPLLFCTTLSLVGRDIRTTPCPIHGMLSTRVEPTNQPTNQQMSKQVNQSASHCSIMRLSCGSTIAMNLALIKVRTWAGNTFTNTSENHRVVISDTSTECSIKCADSAGICSLINSFIVSWSTCCV